MVSGSSENPFTAGGNESISRSIELIATQPDVPVTIAVTDCSFVIEYDDPLAPAVGLQVRMLGGKTPVATIVVFIKEAEQYVIGSVGGGLSKLYPMLSVNRGGAGV